MKYRVEARGVIIIEASSEEEASEIAKETRVEDYKFWDFEAEEI